MCRIHLAFLLSLLAMSAVGQVIAGRVLDQETREPIPLALVFFDCDGFYDPAAIMWSGKMGSQRIADFLPYEYSVDR